MRPLIRGAVFAAIAWIGLTSAGVAQAPAITFLTFPVLSGRVVDDAGLLSATDRVALTASLADLEAKTTDQLVVVTLKSLQGTTIENYGYQLGRRWLIGQKDKDSGVLLIVAAAERRVRIEVGYGLEGKLTDAATRLIIENSILPAFKTGDFAGGIKNGTSQIIQTLGGDAVNTPSFPIRSGAGNRSTTGTPVWLVIVLGLGGVSLLIFCAVKGGAASGLPSFSERLEQQSSSVSGGGSSSQI